MANFRRQNAVLFDRLVLKFGYIYYPEVKAPSFSEASVTLPVYQFKGFISLKTYSWFVNTAMPIMNVK